MSQIVQQANKYWIITFSSTDAHIVKTDKKEIFNPAKTYRVYQDRLKYRFLDIDSQARKEVKAIVESIDPNLLIDTGSLALDEILSQPWMQDIDKNIDLDFLEKALKSLREAPEEIKRERIRRYDLAQTDPEELYQEIKRDLEQKRDSTVEEIPNFTKGELLFGLPQAGYVQGLKGFPNLDSALKTLYSAWESIRRDPEKMKLAMALETQAPREAQKRIESILDSF